MYSGNQFIHSMTYARSHTVYNPSLSIYLYVKFNIIYIFERISYLEYIEVKGFFNILNLKAVFYENEIKFLFKWLKNWIDYPELLECMHFKINQTGSRDKSLFYFKKKYYEKLPNKLFV